MSHKGNDYLEDYVNDMPQNPRPPKKQLHALEESWDKLNARLFKAESIKDWRKEKTDFARARVKELEFQLEEAKEELDRLDDREWITNHMVMDISDRLGTLEDMIHDEREKLD